MLNLHSYRHEKRPQQERAGNMYHVYISQAGRNSTMMDIQAEDNGEALIKAIQDGLLDYYDKSISLVIMVVMETTQP